MNIGRCSICGEKGELAKQIYDENYVNKEGWICKGCYALYLNHDDEALVEKIVGKIGRKHV